MWCLSDVCGEKDDALADRQYDDNIVVRTLVERKREVVEDFAGLYARNDAALDAWFHVHMLYSPQTPRSGCDRVAEVSLCSTAVMCNSRS